MTKRLAVRFGGYSQYFHRGGLNWRNWREMRGMRTCEPACEPANWNLRTCEPANLRTGSGTCELAVELAVEPANWALACLVELALELQGHPHLASRDQLR